MNRFDEYDEIQRLFDNKKDEILKSEEEKKQEVDDLFAKVYIELIKEVIKTAKKFDKTYLINLETTGIGQYICLSSVEDYGCVMSREIVSIHFYFYEGASVLTTDEYRRYYNNESINQKLNDLGIYVIFEKNLINITFEREKVKVNKSSESEQTVQEPSASARTLKP